MFTPSYTGNAVWPGRLRSLSLSKKITSSATFAVRIHEAGWTAFVDVPAATAGTVDPTKISLSIAPPSTDTWGVSMTGVSTTTVTGVSSNIDPWWDANNTFPSTQTKSGYITIPIKLNKPVRKGYTVGATISAGVVPGAGAGTAFATNYSTLRPLRYAQDRYTSYTDAIGGVDVSTGCRKMASVAAGSASTLIPVSSASLPANVSLDTPNGRIIIGNGDSDSFAYVINGLDMRAAVNSGKSYYITTSCQTVTIRDCLFDDLGGDHCIEYTGGSTGAALVTANIEWLQMDGTTKAGNGAVVNDHSYFAQIACAGTTNYRHVLLHWSTGDGIQQGGGIVEKCVFEDTGWDNRQGGANHSDHIVFISQVNPAIKIEARYNYVDSWGQQPLAGSPWTDNGYLYPYGAITGGWALDLEDSQYSGHGFPEKNTAWAVNTHRFTNVEIHHNVSRANQTSFDLTQGYRETSRTDVFTPGGADDLRYAYGINIHNNMVQKPLIQPTWVYPWGDPYRTAPDTIFLNNTNELGVLWEDPSLLGHYPGVWPADSQWGMAVDHSTANGGDNLTFTLSLERCLAQYGTATINVAQSGSGFTNSLATDIATAIGLFTTAGVSGISFSGSTLTLTNAARGIDKGQGHAGLHLTIVRPLALAASGTHSMTLSAASQGSIVSATATSTVTASVTNTDAAITSVRSDGWSVNMSTPATAKALSLTRAGFTTTGTSTTYSQVLNTTARVRQAYPSQASLDTQRAALPDWVLSTDTIVGGSATNSSALLSPKPIAKWVYPDKNTYGNSISREHLAIVAGHCFAQNQEEIACIIWTISDGTTTVTATRSVSEISTQVGDKVPVPVYMPSVDVNITTLSAGAITINAKVYPWIGASNGTYSLSSINDSSLNTGRDFVTQRAIKNVTRFTSPYYAYISPTGNNGTGVASQTAATASATPYADFATALSALRTATGGDVSGCILRVKAGTNVVNDPNFAGDFTSAGGELIVECDPNASSTTAILGIGANWHLSDGAISGIRFRNVTLKRTAFCFIYGGGTNATITLENAFIDAGSQSLSFFTNTPIVRLNGVTITNNGSTDFESSTNQEFRLTRGITITSAILDKFCIIGSIITSSVTTSYGFTDSNSTIRYNKFLKCNDTSTSTIIFDGTTSNTVVGVDISHNIFEKTETAAVTAFRPSGDSDSYSVTHLVAHHNTFAGSLNVGRGNILYDEKPGSGTVRTHTLHSFVGNIHVQINTKGDVFLGSNGNGSPDPTNAPLHVGNWGYLYGVGCRGEFSQYIDAAAGGLGSVFAQTYAGIGANIGTSSTTRNDPLFTNFQATTWNGSTYTAGTGNGTYTVGGGSPCKGIVTTPIRKFDLAGTTVTLTGGKDTAGAYN